MEIDRMIRGDGDGVIHIKMGIPSMPKEIICGEKNYNKYIFIDDIMNGRYFLSSDKTKDIKFCIKCLRSYKTDTDMVGFTGNISNMKKDFEGMIHRRHSDTNSYSKCGLPVWDVRDLRHYIQGDAIHANKDKLIDCRLCSTKKITTFEE